MLEMFQAVTQTYDTMKRNRAARNGDLTAEIKSIVDVCLEQASEIFDPIVNRAHTAEKVWTSTVAFVGVVGIIRVVGVGMVLSARIVIGVVYLFVYSYLFG